MATRSRLPQFSLSTLLLLTTIAALAVTTFTLWRKVEPLRREVRRLRDIVGELDVTDETKLHAVEIETETELHWKWTVWIPEGEHFVLRMSTKEIPVTGIPEIAQQSIPLRASGEQIVIGYRIGKEPSGKFVGRLSVDQQLFVHAGNELDWVAWGRRIIERRGVGRATQQGRDGKPLLLFRYRVSETAAAIPQIEDPSNGVAIWLKPQ